MVELDPKYDGPKTATVLRLTEDGSYKQVFEGPITPATPWLRYAYSKFDFTAVKDPGLYVIDASIKYSVGKRPDPWFYDLKRDGDGPPVFGLLKTAGPEVEAMLSVSLEEGIE